MSGDLIVSDSEYLSAAEYVRAYGDRLSDAANEYLSILQRVSNYAISDKSICERLRIIHFSVSKIPGLIDSLTDSASAQMKNFVKDIDTADKNLY